MPKGVYVKSEEHRAKLAEANRRVWAERKAAGLPAPNLGVKLSDETRARMSAGKIGNKNAQRHGMAATPTHNSWRDMLARCTNPKAPNWKYYGARGITVHEPWRDFSAFLADVGERPEGRTLDRIDVNGNYEPGNVRWATASEQAANRRRWGGDAR